MGFIRCTFVMDYWVYGPLSAVSQYQRRIEPIFSVFFLFCFLCWASFFFAHTVQTDELLTYCGVARWGAALRSPIPPSQVHTGLWLVGRRWPDVGDTGKGSSSALSSSSSSSKWRTMSSIVPLPAHVLLEWKVVHLQLKLAKTDAGLEESLQSKTWRRRVGRFGW